MITGMEVFCDSIEDLKVYDIISDCGFVNDFADIFFLNTAFYNLESESFDFVRGARTEKEFYITQDGVKDIYIKEYYKYTFSADKRDILSVDEKIIEYYMNEPNEDGSLQVGMRKTIKKKQKEKKLEEINRTVRYGRIDYLVTAAKNLLKAYEALPAVVDLPTVQFLVSQGTIPSEVQGFPMNSVAVYDIFRNGLLSVHDGIQALLTHYQDQIYNYKENGFDTFENSIVNETNPQFIALLDTLARVPDDTFPVGLTVRQSILYQLNGDIPT